MRIDFLKLGRLACTAFIGTVLFGDLRSSERPPSKPPSISEEQTSADGKWKWIGGEWVRNYNAIDPARSGPR